MTIRVALVDDQELIRTGLAMIVGATDGMTVVVEASDGEQAVAAIARTPVDVVLMDIRMPRMDGVEATRQLLAQPTPSWRRRRPDGCSTTCCAPAAPLSITTRPRC